jgi:hypothetical protein
MDIKITIANKHCTVQGAPVIVCGNSDYTMTFTFDAEWDKATEKTARFSYVRDGVRRYQDVKLTGDTAAVPAVYGTRELQVGVYAGDLVTSTPARIPCKKSIVCCTCAPEDLYPGPAAELRAELEALRQEVAASHRDYELIEDITLEAAVSYFTRNKDTNGVAYNFSAITIIVSAPACPNADSGTAYSLIFIPQDADEKYLYYHEHRNGVGTSKRTCIFKARSDHGLCDGYSFATNANSGNVYAEPGYNGPLWRNVAKIQLTIYPSIPIPAGTRIQIYGVRG